MSLNNQQELHAARLLKASSRSHTINQDLSFVGAMTDSGSD